jgi:hypothetical protein
MLIIFELCKSCDKKTLIRIIINKDSLIRITIIIYS